METKKPEPRLLKTYEEARLLLEARGHGLAKATGHLQSLEELEGFAVSHAVFSTKTSKGRVVPIEPEVAVAIEGMEALPWYVRRGKIVEAGLRAVHGEPPIVDVDVDVHQLAKDLREQLPASELALELAKALEEKAGQGLLENVACSIADRLRATRVVQELVERVGRFSWKHVAVNAVVASLVGCLTLLLAATPSVSPLVVLLPGAGPDGSTVHFDPESMLAMSALGEKRLDQPIPVKTLPGQKVAPCDEGLGQETINGNCWFASRNVKPPCGRLFRKGDVCYAPVAADPAKPVPTPTP